MANNYCQASSFLEVPEDKRELLTEQLLDEAYAAASRAVAHMWDIDPDTEPNDDWMQEVSTGLEYKTESSGIWLGDDESFNPDAAAAFARVIIDRLELDEPFYCTWAEFCSKPRIDAFGGGGFVVKRGFKTFFTSAVYEVENAVLKDKLEKETK
jgi:hypothetical protein